jgi:hypothetical protein
MTLRTFSDVALDEMCKRRPEGYKAAVLALAVKRPDGQYDLDVSTEAYFALRNKYAAASLPPEFDPKQLSQRKHQTLMMQARQTSKEQLKALMLEDIYRKASSIIDILGAASAFAYAYAAFLELEKGGGCRSCRRKGQLMKLRDGLKISLYGATAERGQAVRALFPDSVYFEVVPAVLKWDDLVTRK